MIDIIFIHLDIEVKFMVLKCSDAPLPPGVSSVAS